MELEAEGIVERVTHGEEEAETDGVGDLEAVGVVEPVKDAVPEFVRDGVGDSLGEAVTLAVTEGERVAVSEATGEREPVLERVEVGVAAAESEAVVVGVGRFVLRKARAKVATRERWAGCARLGLHAVQARGAYASSDDSRRNGQRGRRRLALRVRGRARRGLLRAPARRDRRGGGGRWRWRK